MKQLSDREFKMSGITDQVSTSIDALMKEYEIITHNLANASTAGFKRRCNAFSRVLDEQNTQDENFSPGTIDLNSAFDFSQGSIVETGRKLDFALYGKGFFVIETPEGIQTVVQLRVNQDKFQFQAIMESHKFLFQMMVLLVQMVIQ